MCGIAGFLPRFEIAEKRELLKRMTDIITYRGPDEEGHFIRDNVAMGMRRLSIIDLKGGSQPIYNEDETIAIVYNGEVFNYKDLQNELKSLGHIFKSDCDTETIVHAYEEYGFDCINKLNGMFGFAIWDSKKEILFIARDRLGVKPMHYYHDDESFVFGSEIKSILEFPGVNRQIDPVALNLYLAFYYIPAPYTIFKGIKKLLPGHYMVISKDKEPVINKYWDIKRDDKIYNLSYEEHKSNIRNLLSDSVSRRMIADVPLGAFLSGGIDSSIVVGLMARSSSKPVETFNIAFKDYKVYDESDRARAVASFNKTNHHEFVLEYNDLMEVLPKIIWDLEEPFADSSAIPTYYVARETRKHVTVALSGDGGDELFGGYTKYTGEYWLGLYNRLPVLLRKQVVERIIDILPAGRGNRFKELTRKAKKFLRSNGALAEERHHGLMLSFSDDMRASLLADNEQLVREVSQNIVNEYFLRYENADNLFRMSYTDLKLALPDDMLTKVDKMTMLNSLEARTPFLDYRLAEYAFNVPSKYKLVGTNGKYILKDTFKDLLPEGILNKPKSGFGVPVGEWFKKDLNSLLMETLSKNKIETQGLFSYNYISGLIEDHISERNDFTPQIWSLLVFELWYEMYMR